MTVKYALCVLACLAWAPLLVAEESDAVATATKADVSTGKDIDISQLIMAVSQRTHKKFLIDPRVRAVVSLVGIDAREVSYPLLQTIFAVHGFTSYEQNGVVVVIPDANARQNPTALMSGDTIKGNDAEWVTALVPVKNVSAAQLVPVLRPLMPQNAQLSQVTGQNTLIVVDRADNVRRMIAIVRAVEKLPTEKKVEEKAE